MIIWWRSIIDKMAMIDKLKTYLAENDMELEVEVENTKDDFNYDALSLSRSFVNCFIEFKEKFKNFSSSDFDDFIKTNLVVSSELISLNMDYGGGEQFGDYKILENIKDIVRKNYFDIHGFFVVYAKVSKKKDISDEGDSMLKELEDKND